MPSRYNVTVAPSALAELLEVGTYLKERSPQAAQKLVRILSDAFESLEAQPNRGAMIPENGIWGSQYRHLIREPYRIIYRVSGHEVRVLKVVHGARLLDEEPGS